MNHEVVINKGEWVKKGDEEIVSVYGLPKQYLVKYQVYKYNDRNKHYWEQIEINILKNNEQFLTIGRNYSSIVQPIYAHQNGKDFLITSGNYMCITIVNLTDGTVESYTDEDAYKEGGAYCPICFTSWNEESSTLQFKGCVWGGEYYLIKFTGVDLECPIFDFYKAKYELDESDEDYDDYEEEMYD